VQVFSTAFITLFHITAGDPWPEDPQLYNENGFVIWKVAIFHMTYEICVGWVILQVRAVCSNINSRGQVSLSRGSDRELWSGAGVGVGGGK
jgi:hypothetical protein